MDPNASTEGEAVISTEGEGISHEAPSRQDSQDVLDNSFFFDPRIQELNETFQGFLLDMLQFSYTHSFPPHIFSSPLIPETHDIDTAGLLNRLASLISREMEDMALSPPDESPVPKESPEQVHFSMLMSQISAVIHSPAIVSTDQRRAIERQVEMSVVEWLKRAFGIYTVKYVLFQGGLYPSANPLDFPLVPVLRCALQKSSGVASSTLSIPVIYISADTAADDFEATVSVCWPVVGSFYGIQNVLVRRISCLRHSEIMDVGDLERAVNADVAAGKRPCLVVGKAGSPIMGQVDDLKALREICDQFGMWLHVTGPASCLLITSESNIVEGLPPMESPVLNVLKFALAADSLETHPGSLLSISALPGFTFFFTVDPRDKDPMRALSTLVSTGHVPLIPPQLTTNLARPVSTPLDVIVSGPGRLSITPQARKGRRGSVEKGWKHPAELLTVLPIWVIAQTVGASMIERTLRKAHQLVNSMSDFIGKEDTLLCVNPQEATALTCIVRFHPTLNRNYFEANLDVMLSLNNERVLSSPTRGEDISMEERVGYFAHVGDGDMGTKYIFSLFSDDMRHHLCLDLISVSGLLCIRYRPLSADASPQSQEDQALNFTSQLAHEAEKVDSALKYNHIFEHVVSKHSPTLRYLKSWAVGAVADSVVLPRGSIVRASNGGSSLTGSTVDSIGGPRTPRVVVDAGSDEETIWVGLGAIRYTPMYVELDKPSLSNTVLRDLDYLNGRIADELAKQYGSLFSRGQAAAGILSEGGAGICIRVGLDEVPFTEDLIEHCVEIVLKKGMELERDPAYMEDIANVIRDGIAQAERELRSEADGESILRSIPIVGSLVSYIAPEPLKIKSRVKAFTISSGFSTAPLQSPDGPTRRTSNGEALNPRTSTTSASDPST
ncbi:hypothetical protein SmJEL517_g01296 [Synchytrium microbalum]|uniref:Uncharacterized protein n=1 Tax=Synchytrium microbalum TaxID=1806994 RepID=A0A507CG74_9FUNG|nr:uncharacterized protein SmJEL517_g01296 [Synchytrium microbalum]TPX36595.1 hypothetical protein SmJEL517_g01296 [Synchytrium microbalum]